ncbi:hypothetical protein ACIBCT_20730 [Streptosporangium sp. NPDC050855]|uniref:hypothetical protein n=1 Tax=Streptosporangium sp. NPDC050855 TaxID=3366194 RepID=UPI00378EFA1F
MTRYQDAVSAYLDCGELRILAAPDPITDPVERYERLLEWADDRHDDDRGDDEQ